MWIAGDGAGVLVAIPHVFFAEAVQRECGVKLPGLDNYAIAQVFMPTDSELHAKVLATFRTVAEELGHKVLAIRKVQTDHSELGDSAKMTEPLIEQIFFSKSASGKTAHLETEQQACILVSDSQLPSNCP